MKEQSCTFRLGKLYFWFCRLYCTNGTKNTTNKSYAFLSSFQSMRILPHRGENIFSSVWEKIIITTRKDSHPYEKKPLIRRKSFLVVALWLFADHHPLNEYDLTFSTVLPAVHFGYDNGGRSIIRKVTCCSEEAPTKPKPPDTFWGTMTGSIKVSL